MSGSSKYSNSVISSRCKTGAGFTFVELMLVLLILGLLASITVPVVSTLVLRAKEAALQETLQVTRQAIDEYYADKQEYPESLASLVEEKYLRQIPHDPIERSSERWQFTEAESGGIIDLHSNSDNEASNGGVYSDW